MKRRERMRQSARVLGCGGPTPFIRVRGLGRLIYEAAWNPLISCELPNNVSPEWPGVADACLSISHFDDDGLVADCLFGTAAGPDG